MARPIPVTLDDMALAEAQAAGLDWKSVLFNDRFRLVADLTGDGAFTISDVWAWFKWIYFAPGDLASILLLDTGLGNFLEMSVDTLSGLGSGVFSLFFWLLMFAFYAGAIDG